MKISPKIQPKFKMSLSKLKILSKNWKFHQKLKISSKIEILPKIENFVKIWKFCQNLKISLKIEKFIKKWTCWKFGPKLKISPKNKNLAQISQNF